MQQMEEALQTLERGPLDVNELARMRAIGDHVHRRRSFFMCLSITRPEYG
jgi:hypothetical protein